MELTKDNLETSIEIATDKLIVMAMEICWNKISRNCKYVKSEIDDRKDKKNSISELVPKSLSEMVLELSLIYENLYDINLYIKKSSKKWTLIEIRYYLKTSHTSEYYHEIKNKAPMLHCKINLPPYSQTSNYAEENTRKFDVNWELGGIRHIWNRFIGKIKFYWKRK